MRGAGGTDGGLSTFFVGAAMLIGAVWFFLDSVSVTMGRGYLGRYYGGSMLITMAPLMLGIFLLFLNSTNKIAWVVSTIGLVIIVLEVISTLRFHMHMKLWQWIILLIFALGGLALMVKSFKSTTSQAIE